eukprot:359834-Chlamydomonas_euryale.AAC.5
MPHAWRASPPRYWDGRTPRAELPPPPHSRLYSSRSPLCDPLGAALAALLLRARARSAARRQQLPASGGARRPARAAGRQLL